MKRFLVFQQFSAANCHIEYSNAHHTWGLGGIAHVHAWFSQGAVARQVIYGYQLLHSTRRVCFFFVIHNWCFQTFQKLCCSTSVISKMFGNAVREFPPIPNNLISPVQRSGGTCFKHRSMF